MTLIGFLFLGIVIALPIAWLVSEFCGGTWLRILLGALVFGTFTVCAWSASSLLTRLEYNTYYGEATGNLVRTSLEQIEDGHLDRVLRVWRGLERQYQPTYENRASYRELTEEAVCRMRGDEPIEPGSAWDASVFESKTWVGHWQDDEGYWFVISGTGRNFDIVRSGDPPAKMDFVSVSPDFATLKFNEADQWSHTVVLKNKYEATHEWFDAAKGTLWKTDTMHKLIRASDEQERMTQLH